MKESVITCGIQRTQRGIHLVGLGQLIGDMEIKLLISTVALVRVIPQASCFLRQLRGVRDVDELVVGFDPVAVSETAFVSSNRL
jgi:hypothetical protein